MNARTLASAFQAALERQTAASAAAPAKADQPLIAALARSATVCDQIIQRRIGLATPRPSAA